MSFPALLRTQDACPPCGATWRPRGTGPGAGRDASAPGRGGHARRRAARRRLALALLGLLLPGCGPNAPAESAAYFPLARGTRWIYEIRTPEARGELVAVSRGPVELPGIAGPVLLVDETLDPALGLGGGTAPVAYVLEDGFVARREGVGYDATGRLRALGQNRPTRILPLAPRPGAHWSQANLPLGATSGEDLPRLRWEAELRALEAVEVPAGSYRDAIVVETVLRDAAGHVRMTYRDVFVRDVGLVSSVARAPDAPAPALEKHLVRFEPAAAPDQNW